MATDTNMIIPAHPDEGLLTTGTIRTRAATQQYRDNYERIFMKKKKKTPKPKKRGY